jgi:hypothetical protein
MVMVVVADSILVGGNDGDFDYADSFTTKLSKSQILT